jgi:hypothetical protein
MEQFNQTMSRAAVQEADRLAKKLVASAAKIKELDEEADCLFDSLEKLVDEKRKRDSDFHIRLLKGKLEVRKTYPSGVPQGPSPEQLRKQREAGEKQKRKDAEWEEKCKKDFENSPMQLYLKDVKANLARDPEFYRRQPAPAFMRREFLDSWEKKALDTACAVWLKRFGSQLTEIMTADQCNKAVKVGYDLLK